MSLILRTAFRKNFPGALCRSFHATPVTSAKSFDKWYFEIRGFNKYGILEDDFQVELLPDVAEALRRLPEDLLMARTYRAIAAQQAELCHTILPKEKWTKFEDDHHYLKPYIEEVKKEREEREEWDANH